MPDIVGGVQDCEEAKRGETREDEVENGRGDHVREGTTVPPRQMALNSYFRIAADWPLLTTCN